MSAVSGDPRSSNSFVIYVEDELGEKFCWSACSNREGALRAAQKHCRWWISYMRRNAGKVRDSRGVRVYGPCGKTRIVVEFYDDKSSSA